MATRWDSTFDIIERATLESLHTPFIPSIFHDCGATVFTASLAAGYSNVEKIKLHKITLPPNTAFSTEEFNCLPIIICSPNDVKANLIDQFKKNPGCGVLVQSYGLYIMSDNLNKAVNMWAACEKMLQMHK